MWSAESCVSICDDIRISMGPSGKPAWQALPLAMWGLQFWHGQCYERVAGHVYSRDLASADSCIILPQLTLLYPILLSSGLLLMLTADASSWWVSMTQGAAKGRQCTHVGSMADTQQAL